MTTLTFNPNARPHITEDRKEWTSVQRSEIPDSVETIDDVSQPSTEQLVERWIRIAMFHAICHPTQDPVGYIASIAGVRGAWGFGETREDALEELESVLAEWVDLKLSSGDDDIPKMEHISLVPAKG